MKAKTLLAVIEAGSYTKTAQELNLIQPAVSHRIRLLENEFDIKIFYRSKNELKLTPQGRILVQYVRRAAVVYSNACQATADNKMETSHLNVDITPAVGEAIVPQVLAALCSEDPDIHINTCINTVQKIYGRLRAYELDFAVVGGGVSGTALVSTTLDTGYLCLAISPMHCLSRAKTVSVEKMHHEKLILRSRSAGTRQLSEKHLGVRDMNPAEFSAMMKLDSVSMIKELVTMSLEITIIAKNACREELANGRLTIIPIENSSMIRQINIVYQKDFLYPELIRDIRDIYEQLKAR